MNVEELEKQLKSFQSDFEQTKKDFQLKLDSAKKDAADWKSIAEQKEAEAKKFQEEAEKTRKEKEKAMAEAHESEIKSFVEEMIKERRLVPAQRDAVVALMRSLTSEAVIHEFAEKDGSKRSHTQLSVFKELVKSMAPRKEYAGGDASLGGTHSSATPGAGGEEHFQEVFHGKVKTKLPVAEVDLAAKAFEIQEEERKRGIVLPYDEALIRAERTMRQAA